jgi:adenylate cyclase, class 2
MNNIEYECTYLDVDEKQFIKKIENLGAQKVGEFFQRRYTYDFNPKINNKWIRLRTNGDKTTLAIKEIFDKNSIGGNRELEIEVSDFEKTNKILLELGYKYRNYQENFRVIYKLDNIEFDIDSWPLIPKYVEIEGKNELEVKKIIEKLDLDKNKITNYDVTSIYSEIYNIDILNIDILKFE